MSEEFKILGAYMSYLANTLNYDSWKNETVGLEFRENILKCKEDLQKRNIDFSKLSDEEFNILGFRHFDENNKNLIPLWLFRILPDETELICFDGKCELKKDADDDVRFGCTAYMFKF